MWDFGNRAAVVLISVTCGCVLVYNAWGAILALAFTLLLVVYVCYSLLANDSLVSPHAYYVFGYLREAVHELSTVLRIVHGHGTGYVRKLWHSASRCYREHFPPFRMDRRRTDNYQLSSDSYAVRCDESPSRFDLTGQLSPISHVPYGSRINDALRTESRLYHAGDYDYTSQQQQQQPICGKHTSTPILKPGDREQNPRNGDVNMILQSRRLSTRKIPPVHVQDRMLSREENVTQFSPEGSPWGISISPKMRPRPAGVKTVQTVAGPLLASTRYNIDPRVYTDVSSPGLTTRLTKYATEAKNKITHQSQYSTGQFPKVNLNANPIPLLNAKLRKMRMPVTVRVAPPDVTKYSPPERQKILSNVCHAENRSPTNVVQVLREISLKRHASTEDVNFDVAKKQRTEFFNEEIEPIVEENKQKRSRDESKSDEDLSPQSKSVRPAKRTKTRSCYDILNSLSSSVHVATGVKRKAVDFSRSGTPDFEKHFKSLESARSSNSPVVPQSQNLNVDDGKFEFKETCTKNSETLSSKKTEEFPLVKGILKLSNKESRLYLDNTRPIIHKNVKTTSETDNKSAAPKPVKLIDKLFMRAEPERNEQLKSLVEEPGNIKVRFAMDNVEEIKKEDIRNMRQTSMKARLRSMFDAISGKVENKINPDVVIQADDINTVTPPVTHSISCATLNSSTTTTNINTTPLTTAAIVPSGFSSSRLSTKIETKSDAALPKTTSPAQLNVPVMNTLQVKETNLIAKTIGTTEQSKVVSPVIAPAITSTESVKNVVSSIPSTAAPTFTFDKPVKEAPIATSNSKLPNFGIGTHSSNTFTSISSKSTNFLLVNKASSSSTSTLINPTTTQEKIETNKILTTSVISLSNTQTTPTFAFSNNKPVLSPVTPSQITASSLPSQSPKVTLLPVNTTSATSSAGFNTVVNSNTSNSITTSAIAPLFTFVNNSTTLQAPKTDNFMFGQLNSSVQSKMNTFGNPTNNEATSLLQVTTKSFNFTPNTSITTVINSSFTANTTTSTASTFGGSLSSASTFSLGTTSATASVSTLATSKPLFGFGASNTSNTSSSTSIALPVTTANTNSLNTISNNVIPTFGMPTTSTVPQFGTSMTTVPQFRTPTTTVSQFATPTTTVSQFGTPTTTVSQFRTSTTAIPQFGTPTTSIFATPITTTKTNMFGTTNNSQPLFGTGSRTTSETTSIFNTSTTTAPAIFASTTNVVSASSNTPSSSLFSNVNANSPPIITAPSVFGSGTPVFAQASKPSTSFGTASGIFGSTTAAPLFGSTTQTGTTAPAFGITSNVSTSTITPGFDTANNTTSVFGTSGVGTATNVQATPNFGSTTGIFGSTDTNTPSVPIFGGNPPPATEAFNISSATNTFGTQNSPSLTFGAASGTTFGDNKSLFGTTSATSTTFGTSNPSVPAFGASNTNNPSSSTNNMFVFGNNQKDGQQNTTFSFGSNFNAGSTNSTSASTAPFQFGSPSSKPATTGFNFTAPSVTPTLNFGTTTAPTFNPSTPGMFSIGSGSTAPRSRTIRSRKPR